MRTSPLFRAGLALALLGTLHASRCTSLAQGSLTPPGAPAATMKSLDQIEPRTPISSVPYTISAPGSYYLTTNLTVSSGDAITIAVNGVNLDLNGFTLSSTAASAAGNAILLNGGRTNIFIGNGHISSGVTNNGGGYSGSGFASGINYSGFPPSNARVKDVSVVGVLSYGIMLNAGYASVVTCCTVNRAGGYGIYADSVSDSVAYNCGSIAIVAIAVQNCYAASMGSNDGISANTALNCYSYAGGSGDGLVANMAQNCYGYASTSGHGISGNTVENCAGASNSGYGINTYTAQSCWGTSSSNYGLSAAETALNCYANSGSGSGLYAHNAENCQGSSNTGTYGLFAVYSALNCFGSCSSGTGLYAATALNCYGYSTSGTGLAATVANTCIGSRSGGTAIQATIGIGCAAQSGALNVTYKYNMP